MRPVFVALLVGCARATPSPAPPSSGNVAGVTLLEADSDEGQWILGSWTSVPKRAARYELVDEYGALGEVEVTTAVTESECDHCPTHRVHVRGAASRAPGQHVVAIGPIESQLPKARVTFALDVVDWWNPKLSDRTFVRELEVDLDGDGVQDLARFARGPQVEYEVRRRDGQQWIAIERWMTPFVLDSEDAVPEERDEPACDTVADCWLDDEGNPIARPQAMIGKPLPQGDCGSRLSWLRNRLACTNRVCTVTHVGDKC